MAHYMLLSPATSDGGFYVKIASLLLASLHKKANQKTGKVDYICCHHGSLAELIPENLPIRQCNTLAYACQPISSKDNHILLSTYLLPSKYS